MRKVYLEENALKLFTIEEKDLKPNAPKAEKERFLSRLDKYRAERAEEVTFLHNWLEEHLSVVLEKNISKELFDKSSFILLNSANNRPSDNRTLLGQILAEEIELSRFFSDRMDVYLNDIHNTLVSRQLSKAEKKEKLDRDYYFYDLYRFTAYTFFEAVVTHIYSEKICYIDKQGVAVDTVSVFDRLDSLSFPFDFRACEMFCGMYRLLGEEDKLVWAVYYILRYIQKLFFSFRTFAFKTNGTEQTPVLKEVVEDIETVMKSELARLAEELEQIDDDLPLLTAYSLKTTVEIQQIREQVQAVGHKKYEGTVNRINALANSMEALDLLISIINILLEEKSSITKDDFDWYRSALKRFKKYRQDILFYTYKYDDIYDEEHKRIDIKDIVETEKKIEEQLELCDQFDKIISLVEVDNIENLMKEKYTITKKICESGSYPRYIVDRLSSMIDKLVTEIENAITSENLNTLYLSDINALLGKKDKIKELHLQEFTKMLSSAEYLYCTYIVGKEKREDLDYSFVALLYFTALESLLCNCFYIPYVAKICNDMRSDYIDKKEFEKYFDGECYYFITNKRGKIQKTCELGKMGNILTHNYPYKMVQYLDRKLGIRDIEALKKLGNKISQAAKQRNQAAHGTSVVTYEEVIGVKQETFTKSVENEIDVYRGLIVEFFDMIQNK